ncbi:ABC transporter ATP-binding protein [Neobacillus soli]|uniref:ABC transporter ATP-binding protein n=1 Tax=Neobacillus soli TaxID=220688 RepID=UPI0008269BA5|nr:ABC transporter ATP-binding protein [Neobacillus soli]
MSQVFYFIKRLFSYSGNILYLNLFGMGLVSFLEGLGILLLVPMISYSAIINIDLGGFKFLKFLNFLQDFPKIQALVFILGFYISLVLVQNLIQRNLSIRNVRITQGFIRQLRLETYNDLLKANWEFYTKERKADLINVMTMELARVSGGIIQFLLLLASLVFTCIQILIALWLSIKLTIVVLLSGCILAIFSRRFIRQSKLLGTKTSILAQEYLGGITDQLNGIKEIKSNTLEDSRLLWLNFLTKGMIEEQIEYIKLKTTSQIFYKISSACLIAIFIFICVLIFDLQPEQFLLILIIFSRLWPRITEIQSSMEQIATSVPAFKALIDLQKRCKQAAEINDETIYKNIKPLGIEKGIECREVFFRYNRNEGKYALQNINLMIPINCMTAIVGPSGAGKSTLIDLLMGLNKPEHGNILVDGILLAEENLLSLRRLVSYVPQEPFLFNVSIRENLLLIAPNSSDKQIWEALEFSAAAEFVKNLPMGLDTIVGDRGIRLSGGERQRLVLARAILRKPSVLVLDEATSALDSENESKIQEALEKLKGTMTIIVIAHRLSTIRNADQVIVLDQGEIIQQGQFNQLASEKRGVFSSLLRKQMGISV